ncbi:signal recognition particle 9 kDa protein [Bombyx mandarina]|uniref:Signal recognition particle 9 kDa protein n=2 Tax=Bombyx TaxID=7090 RepID=Q0N2S0_BOMMO|nr:signal recognition particle 9 kDa protein [Bombyx mori]XP_028039158.1 signal recognition particle 9 kDa protein [Bombyx mandarina]ABH10801.1 signal recognition particle 9 kDa protein [Bombyx mori]
MTFVPNWEEFEKAAEMLYLQDPINTRYSVKYSHSKGAFNVKITDNKKCLQYKTEVQQDVRKIDKFMSNLLRHMASNDN